MGREPRCKKVRETVGQVAQIKEMLLAPVARSALIIGKVLAGFPTAFLMGVLVL